jgi:hypothetical protein
MVSIVSRQSVRFFQTEPQSAAITRERLRGKKGEGRGERDVSEQRTRNEKSKQMGNSRKLEGLRRTKSKLERAKSRADATALAAATRRGAG